MCLYIVMVCIDGMIASMCPCVLLAASSAVLDECLLQFGGHLLHTHVDTV